VSGNTKQVIQDYDTVFDSDNSIPFRQNDLLRITYFRIPGVPGLHFVPVPCVCVYYCRTYYKAVRGGEEESGGHVL